MNRKNKDTFTRSDIEAALLKEFPEIGKNKISEAINIIFETICDSVALDEKVEIRGFGTFFVKKIKENHSARNPRTGELIYVPERNKVRFKASKKLNKIINR